MVVKHPWEPVVRAVLEKLDAVRDQRLKAFAPALKTFLEQALNPPIPVDWRDRLDDFVEETRSGGLRIAERSIADIEKLIEQRIAKCKQTQLPNADRRVVSRIAADGAFVQSVIPNASGPPTPPHPSVEMREHREHEAFFDQKIRSAESRLVELQRLLEELGEKLDAAQPEEQVDLDDDVAKIEEQVFRYNDDLESARNAWLLYGLSANHYGRLIAAVPDSYVNSKFTINMADAPAGSATNAAGHARNGPWFWRQMLSRHPNLFSPANKAAINAGRSPIVDPTWVAHNPSHQSFIGSSLIHHHIDQGRIATGLPDPVHRAWNRILHPER